MRYAPQIFIAIALLLVSPVFLVLIFLSGDSCCGENTSGTMAIFTALSVAITLGASFVLHVLVRLVKSGPDAFPLTQSSVVSALPSSLLYIGFWVLMAATAFD